ncbi:hypothetical protein [Kordiimonas marina]|uniref:hypothetical protein n=1 Tax=Kordiimonas marina TaxID=2872312 RepID=UPI001FF55EA5|nr:hypothetical protein [Kordiimonas marina]MCJ9430467.1 hypothetical protein [Kordiimonas marina]
MSTNTAIRSTITGLALALGGLGSQAATADVVVAARPIPYDGPAFRAQHPIRVYVAVDTDTRRGEDIHFDRIALDTLTRQLPPYVRLVDRPYKSDLMIVADQTDYDLDFRVTDRDRLVEPYNRRAHYVRGRCHRFDQAYYTRTHEEGRAMAHYNLEIRMRHFGRDIDQVRLGTNHGYSYATHLKATTNCGFIETSHAPNERVRDLLSKGGQRYRVAVAHQIREAAARDLGNMLAGKVRQLSDQYYDGLAGAVRYQVELRPGRYWRYQNRPGWVVRWQHADRDDWYDRWEDRHHRRHR